MTPDQQRLFLSLSAVLFFAPFVHSYKKKYVLNEGQVQFVNGYIKYGYIVWFLTLIVMGGWIVQQFFPLTLLDTSISIGIYVLLALLIGGILLVFADVTLFDGINTLIPYQHIDNGRSKILRSFLPGINLVYRYKLKSFDKPYRWVKEGLIWWFMFVVLSLVLQSETVSNVFLFVIIIRVVTLISGIDLLPNKEKTYLNRLYHVHLEEIGGWLSGCIRYVGHLVFKRFLGQETLMQSIHHETSIFASSSMRKDMKRTHWLEYVVLLGLTVWAGYQLSREDISRNNLLFPFAYGLFCLRYVLAFWINEIPHIPVVKHTIDGLLWGVATAKKHIPRKKTKQTLTAVSALFVLGSFGWIQTVFAQVPYAGINGDIDLVISDIQVNETYFLNESVDLSLTITNQGDGTLQLPSNDAIPQGFIRCVNGSDEVLSSSVISSLTLLAGDSVTLSNLSLPASLTSVAQSVSLVCTINSNTIFLESDTGNNTADADFLVEPGTSGRFGTSIQDAVAEIETKIDTPSVQTGVGAIQDVVFRIIDDFVIPLAIVAGVLIAIIGFYKLMTSDSDDEISKASNYLIWGTIGIMVMVSAKFIGEVIYFDLFGQGLMTELSGVQLSQEIYNKLVYPFFKVAMYIGIGILFILVVIKAFGFVFGSSEDSVTKSRTILVWSVIGILVILGAKQLVEAIYGTQDEVINDNALTPADIGGSFFEGFSFPFMYEVINWVIGLTAFVILVIIIWQTFKLLVNPQSDDNVKSIGNSVLYILGGILLIGAAYILVNTLIVN